MLTGVVQGFGLGFVFVPLSTIAFATLPPKWRTDAASLFSLVRISARRSASRRRDAACAQNTQIYHQSLAGSCPAHQSGTADGDRVGDLGALLARLNAFITREAAFVAYIDDFKFMMFVTLTTIPLLLL